MAAQTCQTPKPEFSSIFPNFLIHLLMKSRMWSLRCHFHRLLEPRMLSLQNLASRTEHARRPVAWFAQRCLHGLCCVVLYLTFTLPLILIVQNNALNRLIIGSHQLISGINRLIHSITLLTKRIALLLMALINGIDEWP